METLYTPLVLDHFQNPRNAGDLPLPAVYAEVSNPVCGDVMRLAARFEGGRIAEARFQAQGCVASIAAGSWLTEWMRGKTVPDLRALTADAISKSLGGLATASFHAAHLAHDALCALLSAQ